jgi:hypothetical protein
MEAITLEEIVSRTVFQLLPQLLQVGASFPTQKLLEMLP